jgi:DNA-3-methyladenine glycosylase I
MMPKMPKKIARCWPGPGSDDTLMIDYHDTEWGVPLHDDIRHFEFLVLDAFQAGLSWRTILHKRAAFRRAFSGFDPRRVSRFNAAKVDRMMQDAGIVRNRMKIEAAVKNARAFLAVQKEFDSFDAYIWRFTGGGPIDHRLKTFTAMPVTTSESDAMSKDLKARGFAFVGSTICYAYMQAAGMVNDHLVVCPRHGRVSR